MEAVKVKVVWGVVMLRSVAKYAQKVIKEKGTWGAVKFVNLRRVWWQRAVALTAFLEARISFPRIVAAVFLFLIGAVWRICSSYHLHGKKLKKLCDTGPYNWVRHPLYVGSVITTFSLVLGVGGVFSAVVFWFSLFSYVVSIVVEEIAMLLEVKGYEEYRKKVKRAIFPPFLIPRFDWKVLKEGVRRNKEWLNVIVVLVVGGAFLIKALLSSGKDRE